MHNLLQELGWQIVHRESPEQPVHRSRLWLKEHSKLIMQNFMLSYAYISMQLK